MNQQPSLLDLLDSAPARGGRLDADSEAFLERYATTYAEIRSVGAVRGEVSQLRSVARESERLGGPRTLIAVLDDTATIVRVLTTPTVRPSASTAGRRLAAVVAAILLAWGDDEGRRRIEYLERRMPREDRADWYESGVALAGDTKRRRPTGPTIEPSDLLRIIEAADEGRHALRDRALVATLCFSGLMAEEVRTLAGRGLRWEPEAETWSAPVERGGHRTRLPIFGAAVPLLARLRIGSSPDAEAVFGGPRGRPLTERQARRIVLDACKAAGFPLANRTDLLAAVTAYLSEEGFTEHQIAIALGVATVGTIDRRLERHRALDAQRRVARAEATVSGD